MFPEGLGQSALAPNPDWKEAPENLEGRDLVSSEGTDLHPAQHVALPGSWGFGSQLGPPPASEAVRPQSRPPGEGWRESGRC